MRYALLVYSLFAWIGTMPVQAQPFSDDCDGYKGRYEQTKKLLADTRASCEKVFAEKDARISELSDKANEKLKGSHGREVAMAGQVTKTNAEKAQLLAAIETLKGQMLDEATHGRLLGIGRRAWLRKRIKELEKLLETWQNSLRPTS